VTREVIALSGRAEPWVEQYERLAEYSDQRRKELTGMIRPYVDLTDDYGRFICRLVLSLGERPPSSTQDEVVRDLLADAFDFLFDSREMLLSGKCFQAYPLLRRAYETVSLLALCVFDGSTAEQWASGKQIKNEYVRKRLAESPLNENEESLREVYKFFCLAVHPNRGLVPHRFLGEKNKFVLGAIGPPDLVLVADYCRQHLALWFWFAASVAVFYRVEMEGPDPGFGEAYMEVAERVPGMKRDFAEKRKRALEEYKEMFADSSGGTPN
jgi:hypothetical protein